MRKLLVILLMIPFLGFSQELDRGIKFKNGLSEIKKVFKFATFYGAVNGGTSISDLDVYSVTNGLTTTTVRTPFDYSVTFGVRKIARLGYENRANTFYNGTENSFSDAASLDAVAKDNLVALLDAENVPSATASIFDARSIASVPLASLGALKFMTPRTLLAVIVVSLDCKFRSAPSASM